ncbi:hypothetical protein ACIBHX_28705 [Nonomuraea sp. NPDC050536]|uniref:hypothetical protein n=1 Tax=Nonomuraea sp. NPDC050536 TaxID=3364366 RepID=UPI0037CB87A6
MNDKARLAMALAAGYYLGRRHKLRTVALLAMAGAARELRGEDGFLKQGLKMLGTSPELEKITDRLRGDLMEVGKAAAVAATSKQIDSLSTKLRDRAESLRGEQASGEEESEEEPEEPEEPEEEEEEEEEEPAEKKPRTRARRSPVTRARR